MEGTNSGYEKLYNALIRTIREEAKGMKRGEVLSVLNAVNNAVGGAVMYANNQERMDAVLQHLKERTPDE